MTASTPPPRDPADSTLHRVNRLTVVVERAIARGQVVRAVELARTSGLDGLLDVKADRTTRSTFKCPFHGARLAGPCGLDSCRYHVPFEPARSCLLAYCHDHQADRLTVDEIAFLYDVPAQAVRTQTDQAVQAVRASSMDADARHDPQYTKSFRMVPTDETCCACGSVTEISERIPVPDLPVAWCGPSCRRDLPADEVRIEWLYGRPVDVVLGWAVRRYRDPDVLARALGVQPDRLADLCARFGIRPVQAAKPISRKSSG